MRKFLFFAIALVAGVLAFTSCDTKKVDNPIVGTWFTADAEQDYYYIFGEDGAYQRIEDYFMNGRDVVAHEHIVGKGTFKVDGDVVTAKLESLLVYMDGSKDGDPFTEFWPAEEKMKFKIEGNVLTLTHEYDTDSPWTVTLTKK